MLKAHLNLGYCPHPVTVYIGGPTKGYIIITIQLLLRGRAVPNLNPSKSLELCSGCWGSGFRMYFVLGHLHRAGPGCWLCCWNGSDAWLSLQPKAFREVHGIYSWT